MAGGLGEEELLTFTATVAAGSPGDVVLLDSPQAGPYLKAFLAALGPAKVVPVGSFPEGVPESHAAGVQRLERGHLQRAAL